MALSVVPRRCVAQTSRLAHRAIQSSIASRAGFRAAVTSDASLRAGQSSTPAITQSPAWSSQRPFSACACLSRGIMPESSTPTTKDSPPTERRLFVMELSDEEYHEQADHYLNKVLTKFEHLQETREDLDVDYSSGVMTITIADLGTFVINKQPPNKQIWVSSPISGPKRYDWCVSSEGQEDKEGTATGYWVYSRDGTTLDNLVLEEIGVDVESPLDT